MDAPFPARPDAVRSRSTRPAPRQGELRPIPVLLYHGVAPSAPPAMAPWAMHPDRFAAHMQELADEGRPTFTVSGLLDHLDRHGEVPEGAVAITFDDGLADFGRHAWPVLRDLDLRATLYVVTGCVGGTARWLDHVDGGDTPMLGWDEVVELDRQGCEIGSHGETHPQLDVVPRDRLQREVARSREVLDARLGHPVRSFAYPHGYHGRAVVDAVRAAGYDSACAVREMLSSPSDDRYALARVTLTADRTVEDLRGVLAGTDLAVAPAPERLRTKAWRGYRRARTLVGATR